MQVAVVDEIVMWIQAGYKGLEGAAVAANRFSGRLLAYFRSG